MRTGRSLYSISQAGSLICPSLSRLGPSSSVVHLLAASDIEFKRTSDREHGYVQQCDERATEQYAGLLQIIRRIVMSKGWKVQVVNFIAGTKSMNQEAWNKSMETIGVLKQKWDGTRERFMKVLSVSHGEKQELSCLPLKFLFLFRRDILY
jgi:hypothetical protein